MTNETLQLLLTRRSVVANKLAEPGPDDDQLQKILQAAARVPDHKKLVPWRFIIFRGEAREQFGKILSASCKKAEPDASEGRLEFEAGRFLRAPIIICVVSHIKPGTAVPEWEQILSAGAVCQNLIMAATALGYAAQWITEWYAYDETVTAALKLAENERVAGYVYIGSASEPPQERDRPVLDEIVSEWKPID